MAVSVEALPFRQPVAEGQCRALRLDLGEVVGVLPQVRAFVPVVLREDVALGAARIDDGGHRRGLHHALDRSGALHRLEHVAGALDRHVHDLPLRVLG
jgi:hypothetical protein